MKSRTRTLLLLALLGAIATPGYAKEDEDVMLSADELKLKAQGAMRVGADEAIVPDASAEHPLVISRPEVQPLCKPASPLAPSQEVEVMSGYEALVLAQVDKPRKIVVDPADHLLVTSNEGLVSVRLDKCGNADTKQLLDQLDDGPVGYGVALYDGHLYVASSQSVWRFPYVDGQHTPVENGVQVLTNINTQEPFDIAIDPFGHLFTPRPAGEDPLAERHAIIKRFNVHAVPSDSYDFETDGEIFAYGTNVHGAMGFDAQGRLWGIDAPFEPFQRSDLGGEISPHGLAQEMNLYEFPYKNYGFPYCFTEYNLQPYTSQSKGKGAQWGHPSFMNSSVDLDAFCQIDENNRQPAIPLAPKTSASALHFYMGQFCSVGDEKTLGTSVGMPCNWTDTPVVAYRGEPGQADGHRVVHLPFDDLGHKPRLDKNEEVVFQAKSPCNGEGCITPVGVTADSYGRLLISSEETNEIFMVQRIYNVNAARIMTDKVDAAASSDEEGEDDEVSGASLDEEEEDDEEIKAASLDEEEKDDEVSGAAVDEEEEEDEISGAAMDTEEEEDEVSGAAVEDEEEDDVLEADSLDQEEDGESGSKKSKAGNRMSRFDN